jgi:outer membrane lipoprotein-sorting protein
MRVDLIRFRRRLAAALALPAAAILALPVAVLALTMGRADAATLPTGADILSRIETNLRLVSDVSAKVTLTQQKAGQGVKTTQLLFYRRDKDNSFLIDITAPESDKGNGYLRTGDNFWMYRRNTRSFQHVNRDESIAGSDAQGDDFEDRKLTELYAPVKVSSGREKVSEDTLGKVPVFRMEAAAKVYDVDYPRKIYWVRRDNFLVLKEQSFAQSGVLMQTAYYLKYAPVLGKFVAVEQMFIDEFEKGNRTRLAIAAIATAKLSDDIFTKAYLENLSK